MSTTSPRSSRRHMSLSLTFAACVGLLMLAAGTAAAQGWSGRGGPTPVGHGYGHGAYDPGHADCHDSLHHHAVPARGHDHHSGPVVYACDSTIEVRPGMVEHGLAVNTRGAVDCDDVTGTHCPGYVSRRPICLDVRRGLRLDVEVVGADVDTVLALVGPAVVQTDDDGGYGTHSRIIRYLSPGLYRLHVGTYQRRDRGAVSLVLRDADAPRWEPPRGHGHGHGHDDDDDHEDHGRGRGGRGRGHSTSIVYDPAASCPIDSQMVQLNAWQATQWVNTSAAGEIDSSDRMGRFESGWLPSSPQLCLVVDESGYYDIEVSNSSADTVLGVVPVGRGGGLFDDDGGSGWLSRVSGQLDAGTYLVYVGTFGYGQRAPAQLVLTRR